MTVPTASTRPDWRSADLAGQAVYFARHLARTFGPVARFYVCHGDPPAIVGSSEADPRPDDLAEVLAAVRDFAAGAPVTNRPAGRGTRVSVLPFPGQETEALALAVEVDYGPVARAARLLSAIADPDGIGAESATEHLGNTVNRLIDEAESELGVPATELSRGQKQQVVRDLDERGAFLIKKSVEQVAVRLGVSRFTIYNYLDQANRDEGSGPGEAGATKASDHRDG